MPKLKKVHHSLADAKPKVDPIAKNLHTEILEKVCRLHKDLKKAPPTLEEYEVYANMSTIDLQEIYHNTMDRIQLENPPYSDAIPPENKHSNVIEHMQESHFIKDDILKKIYEQYFNKFPPAKDYSKETEENYKSFYDENDMWWRPKEGPQILASKMVTNHLFHALRYVYNTLVDGEFQVPIYNHLIPKIGNNPKQLKNLRILFKLIGQRDDIVETHLEQLSFMAMVTRKKL